MVAGVVGVTGSSDGECRSRAGAGADECAFARRLEPRNDVAAGRECRRARLRRVRAHGPGHVRTFCTLMSVVESLGVNDGHAVA